MRDEEYPDYLSEIRKREMVREQDITHATDAPVVFLPSGYVGAVLLDGTEKETLDLTESYELPDGENKSRAITKATVAYEARLGDLDKSLRRSKGGKSGALKMPETRINEFIHKARKLPKEILDAVNTMQSCEAAMKIEAKVEKFKTMGLDLEMPDVADSNFTLIENPKQKMIEARKIVAPACKELAILVCQGHKDCEYYLGRLHDKSLAQNNERTMASFGVSIDDLWPRQM